MSQQELVQPVLNPLPKEETETQDQPKLNDESDADVKLRWIQAISDCV